MNIKMKSIDEHLDFRSVHQNCMSRPVRKNERQEETLLFKQKYTKMTTTHTVGTIPVLRFHMKCDWFDIIDWLPRLPLFRKRMINVRFIWSRSSSIILTHSFHFTMCIQYRVVFTPPSPRVLLPSLSLFFEEIPSLLRGNEWKKMYSNVGCLWFIRPSFFPSLLQYRNGSFLPHLLALNYTEHYPFSVDALLNKYK